VTTEFSVEPQLPYRVTLETLHGEEWQPHPATIANLTRHEVWIGIKEPLGEAIYPERPVRLVLRRPDGSPQTAETIVLWHIGEDGLVIVLMRPNIWDPPSRRAHSRARLTIPVHLNHEQDGPPVPAWTTNVGVGGVYCLSDVRVPVGQKLPVSLRLTPAESFDCPAEVIRVDENDEDPTGQQVVIALKFLDMTVNDQAKLATALASLADDVDDDYVPRAWRTGEAGS